MKKILNLGCGQKWSSHPNVVNIDWHIYLILKKSRVLRGLSKLVLDQKRQEILKGLQGEFIVHDLRKGIPFDEDSVDGVYHSHLLEHLDRDIASVFLKECHRVLKSGGVIRIVVPDFEPVVRAYVSSLEKVDQGERDPLEHDKQVKWILGQSVRREARGSAKQQSVRRKLENFILGDARKRGQTHQWMYDRANLSGLLLECGFKNPVVVSADQSADPEWSDYLLDRDEAGAEHKPASLYVEATK